MTPVVTVSEKGARRWRNGHPWIFRSDILDATDAHAGAVLVRDCRRHPIGWGLWSPASEISLRMVDRRADATIDAEWWRRRIATAIAHRQGLSSATNGYRLVHGEADGMPSFVCDRYDRWLVVQLLSAGLETFRDEIVHGLLAATEVDGILARNDVPVRARERLPQDVELLHGSVPKEIEVHEHGVRYLAAPWTGQKTGAFLDQRENRAMVASIVPSGGTALDCFSYHGSFALHMARNAASVVALDASAEALERARANADRNGFTNVTCVATDAFEYLRTQERERARFDVIVVDPPPFAKTKSALSGAIRGYKEINLRAMRLVRPGGRLFTASCSFHLHRALFLEMIADAAADSGRRVVLRRLTGQPHDHPEVLTIPETGYLKGALLEVTD